MRYHPAACSFERAAISMLDTAIRKVKRHYRGHMYWKPEYMNIYNSVYWAALRYAWYEVGCYRGDQRRHVFVFLTDRDLLMQTAGGDRQVGLDDILAGPASYENMVAWLRRNIPREANARHHCAVHRVYPDETKRCCDYRVR